MKRKVKQVIALGLRVWTPVQQCAGGHPNRL